MSALELVLWVVTLLGALCGWAILSGLIVALLEARDDERGKYEHLRPPPEQ